MDLLHALTRKVYLKCPFCGTWLPKKTWAWYKERVLVYSMLCRNSDCRHSWLPIDSEHKIYSKRLNLRRMKT